MKQFIILLSLIFFQLNIQAQKKYTHADTLRGMLTPVRSCYDVTQYDLNLKFNLSGQSISGYNIITYKVMIDFDSMQVDLFSNLVIDSIISDEKKLKYKRDGNAIFIKMNERNIAGSQNNISIFYHGKPQIATRPPWDGGFSWNKDINGKAWVGVSCQGTGASCWWPCKDHQSDEPDSMRMSFTIPSDLKCISNGRLISQKVSDDKSSTWIWKVTYPINNYNVTFNIADYASFSDYYFNGKDTLTLDYYVLKYNIDKAKEHFKQVKLMLACYEKHFGAYPFLRDGYKLVETNYWGMEHQSCIAYGNAFLNNKDGFDFIIVHESGHEWWGNNITSTDIADMWIHESFTTYGESLFMECRYDYATAVKYLISQRFQIEDKIPIIGDYNVNAEGPDNDKYYKGSWMIHTLRSVLNDDEKFFALMKSIQSHFALQQINSTELIQYINTYLQKDYTSFFNQYLKQAAPPVLQYHLKKKKKNIIITYRWKVATPDFSMPVEIKTGTEIKRIDATTAWQTIPVPRFDQKLFDLNTDRFYAKKESVKKIID